MYYRRDNDYSANDTEEIRKKKEEERIKYLLDPWQKKSVITEMIDSPMHLKKTNNYVIAKKKKEEEN